MKTKWIFNSVLYTDDLTKVVEMQCPFCKRYALYSCTLNCNELNYEYCPHCGSSMKLKSVAEAGNPGEEFKVEEFQEGTFKFSRGVWFQVNNGTK